MLEPDNGKLLRPVLRGERERKLPYLLGGFKAVSNAIKGRLINDDDQFTLGIVLISTRAQIPACHVYLLPPDNISDFFYMKDNGMLK